MLLHDPSGSLLKNKSRVTSEKVVAKIQIRLDSVGKTEPGVISK